MRYRLAKAQESTAEEPIGEINLHEDVDEVENLAEAQVIRPRPIQVDTIQESVSHLTYFLVPIILRRDSYTVLGLQRCLVDS